MSSGVAQARRATATPSAGSRARSRGGRRSRSRACTPASIASRRVRRAQVEAVRAAVDLEEGAVLGAGRDDAPRRRTRTRRGARAAGPTDGRSRRRAGSRRRRAAALVDRSESWRWPTCSEATTQSSSASSVVVVVERPVDHDVDLGAGEQREAVERPAAYSRICSTWRCTSSASSPMPMPTPGRVVGDRQVVVPGAPAPPRPSRRASPCRPRRRVRVQVAAQVAELRPASGSRPARASASSPSSPRAARAGSAGSRGGGRPRPRRRCWKTSPLSTVSMPHSETSRPRC